MTARLARDQDVRPEPPANYEAEQALLGAILANNAAYDRVFDIVAPEHFADEAHGRIFAACGALIEKGTIANAVTLRAQFDQDEALADVGGAKYLADLQRNYVTIINAPDYARLILDLYQRRGGLYACEDLAEALHDVHNDVAAPQILEEAAGALMELHDGPQAAGGARSLAEAMAGWMANVEAAHKAGGVLGVPTGLADIDLRLGGLVKSDLVVLAGRPGHGKTACGLTVAINVARAGHSVLFASYEMSEEQLAGRAIAAETGIPVTAMRRGNLQDWQFDKLFEAKRALDGLPLRLEAPRIKTVGALRARARQMKRKGGLELVVVDYLQLMSGKGFKRYEEVSEISRELKALAMGLDVPVLALSQLSRQVEGRDDKRPQLSDLRESGAIEQDADTVMFVYREHEYLKNAEPKQRDRESAEDFNGRYASWQNRCLDLAGQAEILIRKNRHGPTADVKLGFDGPRMLFRDAGAERLL